MQTCQCTILRKVAYYLSLGEKYWKKGKSWRISILLKDKFGIQPVTYTTANSCTTWSFSSSILYRLTSSIFLCWYFDKKDCKPIPFEFLPILPISNFHVVIFFFPVWFVFKTVFLLDSKFYSISVQGNGFSITRTC